MQLNSMTVVTLCILCCMSATIHADAAHLWKKKCETCHGAEATGNEVMAKSLSVSPESLDLTRPEVREKSDETLLRIIRRGNWKMPGFSNQMGKKKEQLLLDHLRQLQTPPPTPENTP